MAKERKASVIYDGNASQLVYAFPFDYLRKKFVKVEDIYTNITELTIGVDYTVEDKQVRLVKAIPLGHSVKIYRETTTDPLVEWQDASVLRSADLSLQEVQLLHLAEETADKVFDSGMSTAYGNPNAWDGQYKRIINALDPIEEGDVVTLRYIKANQSSLLNQLKNTGAAQNSSIVATGDAQNTRLTSTGDTQNIRLNNTGNTQNKRLTDTGDSYVSTMTTLKDTATTKATEAGNSAALSKKWAMSDTSPDGVSGNKSSKTWANEAKTSASNSAASASDSQYSASNAEGYANDAYAYANASEGNAPAGESAKTWAIRAQSMANRASNSESAAASSASAASTSASNAKTSETNAAASAKAAKQSEENAKTWDPTQYAKIDQVAILTNDAFSFDEHTDYTDINDTRLFYISSGVCIYDNSAKKIANLPRQSAFRLFNIRNIKSTDTVAGHWFSCMQFIIYVSTAQIFWRFVTQDMDAAEPTFYPWTLYDSPSLISRIPEATQAAHGYMSAMDKKKLDGISANIDSTVSTLSAKVDAHFNDSGHLVLGESELWIE